MEEEHRVPNYLKKYVVDQNYDQYTPRDHAVWRFIMTTAENFFARHAHHIYLEGLRKAGIPLELLDQQGAAERCGWRRLRRAAHHQRPQF